MDTQKEIEDRTISHFLKRFKNGESKSAHEKRIDFSKPIIKKIFNDLYNSIFMNPNRPDTEHDILNTLLCASQMIDIVGRAGDYDDLREWAIVRQQAIEQLINFE